jgi:(p)ppGpp synthase/HD superfamily hydrolase
VLIAKAFEYASEIHGDQVRKASIVPGVSYMSHLMEVAGMVQASGGNDETVAAALLHDSLEDTVATLAGISDHFGLEVASLVQECTEARTEGSNGAFKAPWKGRKQAYLDHLSIVSPHALLISVADKLQSLREVRRQVRIQGNNAYAAFAKRDFASVAERKEAVLWFHQALAEAFQSRSDALKGDRLIPGIQALVDDFKEILAAI